MKNAALVLIIALLFTQLAQARGEVSSLSLNMIQFTGDKSKSLVGSYGYALEFTASNDDGAFRLQYGADFQYAKVRSYIANTGRNGTYYGTDFKAGFAIVPVPKAFISPFIEAAALLGIKSLSFDTTPTTLPRETIAPSYGYRFGVGVNLDVFNSNSLRLAAHYVDSRATKLAEQKNYNLSSLTFSLGLNF